MWLFFNTFSVPYNIKAEPIERFSNSSSWSRGRNTSDRGESDRVISGSPWPHSAYPFLVSVQKSGTHICGGSIVTRDAILTACQCLGILDDSGLQYYQPKDVQVVAGIGQISKSSPEKQAVKAKSLVAHPKCSFDNTGIVNDVGIIKLSKPLNFNNETKAVKIFSTVATIALSQLRSYQRTGTVCSIPGWGKTSRQKSSSNSLINCKMALRTPGECRNMLCEQSKSYCDYRFYLKGQLCAVSSLKNCRPCEGDQGGPLMCEGFLYGMFRSNNYCEPKYPPVFTHIEPILYLIKSQTSFKTRSSSGVVTISKRVFYIVLLLMLKFL